ncbi:MAG: class I SAM-dependent methyltransferase [Blastocatellia bacterium]|nr:class I SAM-dependent methyltransferase [Blastocatellia bacterium]
MGLYSNYIFPRLLDRSLGTEEVGEQRSRALAPVRGEALEIGFGTGLNLPYYPQEVTRLTAIDSEQMLADRVAKRIDEARMPVEQFHLDASHRMPFEDQRFDSVVSTFTLCSIADLPSALAEIRRVLKPEGRFIFLEHGRSDDARVARRQDFFNPIQRIVGRGCNMNRAIDRLIEEAGFEIETLARFLMPGSPRILGEMYRGAAKICDR